MKSSFLNVHQQYSKWRKIQHGCLIILKSRVGKGVFSFQRANLVGSLFLKDDRYQHYRMTQAPQVSRVDAITAIKVYQRYSNVNRPMDVGLG